VRRKTVTVSHVLPERIETHASTRRTLGKEETMKTVTIQIPIEIAKELVGCIEVGSEFMEDEAKYNQLLTLSKEISDALDNIG
jgi:hypothetical protein